MKTKTTSILVVAVMCCAMFCIVPKVEAYEYVPKSPEVKAIESESRAATRLIVAAIEEAAPNMLILSGSMVFASLVIAFAAIAPHLSKKTQQ